MLCNASATSLRCSIWCRKMRNPSADGVPWNCFFLGCCSSAIDVFHDCVRCRAMLCHNSCLGLVVKALPSSPANLVVTFLPKAVGHVCHPSASPCFVFLVHVLVPVPWFLFPFMFLFLLLFLSVFVPVRSCSCSHSCLVRVRSCAWW